MLLWRRNSIKYRHPRFIVRMVILILGAVIVLVTFYLVSLKTSPVARLLHEDTLKLETITAITVGHSHSLAIDFATLGDKGLHLYVGGSDLIDASVMVHAISPSLPHLGYVFIPLNYLFWAHDNDRLSRTYTRYNTCLTFMVINPWACTRLGFRPAMQAWLSPLARPDSGAGMVRYFLKTMNASEGSRLTGFSLFVQQPEPPVWEPSKVDVSAPNFRANAHIDTLLVEQENWPVIQAHVLKEIYAIDQLGKTRGFRAIFYTPPYTKEYHRQFETRAPQLLATWRTLTHGFKTVDNLEYYDLSQCCNAHETPALFKDADHLNPNGARVVSARLKAAIKERSR